MDSRSAGGPLHARGVSRHHAINGCHRAVQTPARSKADQAGDRPIEQVHKPSAALQGKLYKAHNGVHFPRAISSLFAVHIGSRRVVLPTIESVRCIIFARDIECQRLAGKFSFRIPLASMIHTLAGPFFHHDRGHNELMRWRWKRRLRQVALCAVVRVPHW